MDRSLRMRPLSPLVHPAAPAHARSPELAQQKLKPSHAIPPLRRLRARGHALPAMVRAEIRFLRQRVRSHGGEPVHVAQTALLLQRRLGQAGRTDDQRQVHPRAQGQGVVEAEVVVAPGRVDHECEVAELTASCAGFGVSVVLFGQNDRRTRQV